MPLTTLSLVSVPVSNQDRAKRFHTRLVGFTELLDSQTGDSARWVMLQPPGISTKVALVTWLPSMPPGSLRGFVLGATEPKRPWPPSSPEVSLTEEQIQQAPWGRWKTFEDPDGNGWIFQQDA